MSRRATRQQVQAACAQEAASVPVESAEGDAPVSAGVSGSSAPRASGEGWELRLGRWQDALRGVTCDCLLFDAPYSATTHAAETTRDDDSDAEGLTPQYDAMTPELIREFCESWASRCRGWWVSVTDSVLAPAWRAEFERVGLYAFAPVACVIRGMSVRLQGDGPSSWCLWAVVARPRTVEFARWGTLPGAYTGPAQRGAGGGRGKPNWLMQALVRDYSRDGDLVCDPFAGWGATLAAAVSLGRRGIGAEMDTEAFTEAQRRLGAPLQTDLFSQQAR